MKLSALQLLVDHLSSSPSLHPGPRSEPLSPLTRASPDSTPVASAYQGSLRGSLEMLVTPGVSSAWDLSGAAVSLPMRERETYLWLARF